MFFGSTKNQSNFPSIEPLNNSTNSIRMVNIEVSIDRETQVEMLFLSEHSHCSDRCPEWLNKFQRMTKLDAKQIVYHFFLINQSISIKKTHSIDLHFHRRSFENRKIQRPNFSRVVLLIFDRPEIINFIWKFSIRSNKNLPQKIDVLWPNVDRRVVVRRYRRMIWATRLKLNMTFPGISPFFWLTVLGTSNSTGFMFVIWN